MEGTEIEEVITESSHVTSAASAITATENTSADNEVAYERGAGVLMHITSLPSPFGVGDMGPEAIAFADFLERTNQKFWQLLPINPTEEGQGHSPYSAVSSRAGNILLISPELLAQQGLLAHDELNENHVANKGQANYREAENIKTALFKKAWQKYNEQRPAELEEKFIAFCKQEEYWLNDFALYSVLKKKNGGKAWYQWVDEYKLRNEKALDKIRAEEAEEIEYVRWLQFVFATQWGNLRSYCNQRNIKLIGDLPFYVSYDSVDVWSNKELFCLDEEGSMTSVAGTPPDAFSSDGQLWGMPIYKWDVLKAQNFDWWVNRLGKNIQLFDLVRIDHFRAFSAFWDVPAGEKTAKNGKWKLCPGADLFEVVQQKFGHLPFIAEDLGDIDEPVYQLRDQFKMPGMVVLLFAFGDTMPQSIYIPHNYTHNSIAYTGTHDNNTVKGWYKNEASDQIKEQISKYTASNVTEENVHLSLGRLAYSSVAKTAILPIQDILGIDESGRMNTPASTSNNWGWRLVPSQLDHQAEDLLKEWTWLYNRQ
jgi:4-alpha-glucanotransferase